MSILILTNACLIYRRCITVQGEFILLRIAISVSVMFPTENRKEAHHAPLAKIQHIKALQLSEEILREQIDKNNESAEHRKRNTPQSAEMSEH